VTRAAAVAFTLGVAVAVGLGVSVAVAVGSGVSVGTAVLVAVAVGSGVSVGTAVGGVQAVATRKHINKLPSRTTRSRINIVRLLSISSHAPSQTAGRIFMSSISDVAR